MMEGNKIEKEGRHMEKDRERKERKRAYETFDWTNNESPLHELNESIVSRITIALKNLKKRTLSYVTSTKQYNIHK